MKDSSKKSWNKWNKLADLENEFMVAGGKGGGEG